MLSSKQLELLLTLERKRSEQGERLCAVRRAEVQTLLAQRAQLEALLAEYQAAQARFSGSANQLQQQARLSERLFNGLTELGAVIAAAQQRLALAEQVLRHTLQRCEAWQRQLSETLAAERRSQRRKERRKIERRWLESHRIQSKI